MKTPTLETLRAEALACAYAQTRDGSHRQARRFGQLVAESACMVDDAYAYIKNPASIAGDRLAEEFFARAEAYARG